MLEFMRIESNMPPFQCNAACHVVTMVLLTHVISLRVHDTMPLFVPYTSILYTEVLDNNQLFVLKNSTNILHPEASFLQPEERKCICTDT